MHYKLSQWKIFMAEEYGFKKMVESASTGKRLSRMEIIEEKSEDRELYRIRLNGIGNRKGHSEITIR